MTTTANIVPTAGTDGIVYCNNVPLTSSEADLGDSAKTPSPIAIEYGQVIVAVVKLAVNGIINVNKTWVFMQTDLGDGTWIDVAWLSFTSTQAPGTFVLCGGGLGAMNNAIQQSRNQGSAPSPQASGSNAIPLGGRVRFTGFVQMQGGSSSAPGVSTQVTATITFKLMDPR